MRAAILGEIFHLRQGTKIPLKYFNTNSNYGDLFAVPASDTQNSFSRAARDKDWVEKNIFHLSGGKEYNKVAIAQYLSKYLFEKYEDQEILPLLNVDCLSALP